jgi:hypothetical protein
MAPGLIGIDRDERMEPRVAFLDGGQADVDELASGELPAPHQRGELGNRTSHQLRVVHE